MSRIARVIVSFMIVAGSNMSAADKRIIRVGPDPGMPFSPAVAAGGLIYVSGALATDVNGRIVPGDIKAQTKQVLDNLGRVLEAAGSSLQNAASVNVYMKNIADFPAMNEIYQTRWTKDPPARTTIAANLVVPEALIEMSVVAIPAGAERKVIHPADWLKSPLPYSYGILSGDTLFLAGLVSRNGRDNQPVGGDMQAQVKVVMKNAGEILQSAGMGYDNVVSSRVFITDTAQFQEMNTAYRGFFPNNPPARATVRAPLVSPQYLVEITLVAIKGAAKEAVTMPGEGGAPGPVNPNLSSAIRAGNRLFVSGMLGNTASNKGDIQGQTKETLSRIGRTLKAAGFGWDHVVDGVVYLTDVKNFGGMNEAYRGTFARDFPARATVETGLVNPEGLVEIMFTAVR